MGLFILLRLRRALLQNLRKEFEGLCIRFLESRASFLDNEFSIAFGCCEELRKSGGELGVFL